jgi:hypothetical protein
VIAANDTRITNITGSVGGLPTFTYPISGTQTKLFSNTISAQTITITFDRSYPPSTQSTLLMLVDGVQVDCAYLDWGLPFIEIEFILPGNVTPSNIITIEVVSGLESCGTTIPGQIAQTSMNYSGQYALVAAGAVNYPQASGFLYVSSNYAAAGSWFTKQNLTTPNSGYDLWGTTSISGDGKYMMAGSNTVNGKIYKSANYGVDWTEITNLPWSIYTINKGVFTTSAISNTGQYQWIGTGKGSDGYDRSHLFRSTDYGATWTLISSNDYYIIVSLAISSTGQYVTYATNATMNIGTAPLYRSSNATDTTPTFTMSTFDQYVNFGFLSVAMSTSGQQQAVCFNFNIFGSQYAYAVSNNYGVSFTINAHQPTAGSNYWPWAKVYVASNTVDGPYGYQNIYGITRVGQNNFAYILDDPGAGSVGVLSIYVAGSGGPEPWYRQMTAMAFSSDHNYMLVGSTNGIVRRPGPLGTLWEEV